MFKPEFVSVQFSFFFFFLAIRELKQGDGNENGKKAIGLDWKTTTLHVHHVFCTFRCRHCTTVA